MFTIQRTLNEFKAIVRLQWRIHAIFLAVYALLVIYIHYVIYHAAIRQEINILPAQILTIIPFCLFAITITSDVLKRFRNSISSTHFIMTPSSTLEKFTAITLYTLIVGFVSLVITYNVAHILSTLIGSWMFKIETPILSEAPSIKDILLTSKNLPFLFQNWSDFWFIFFSVYATTQSIFIFGSTYFIKNPKILTFVAIIAYFFLGFLIVSGATKLWGVETTTNIPMPFGNSKTITTLVLPQSIQDIFNTFKSVISYIMPIACWFGTYWTLKHRQV